MTRLTRLDNDERYHLADDDHCYHYGEYTSGGGFKAGTTNQQIWNLKSKPTSTDKVLYYKSKAIDYWATMILGSLDLAAAASNTTFVPMPCSKPVGHPDYDDRMLKILQKLLAKYPSLDIRPVLIQTELRESQHEGLRKSPDELLETLGLDPAFLSVPLKSRVVILDDVITLGASYTAAKRVLQKVPDVQHVIGIFLAKTVWVPSELDELLNSL
ncbi:MULTISPECIES: hypothetical protein [Pseudomonas syringae group]|uniref:hypothetical protein n=1 Tax=Pseudomonas syringae group TaxID=136849 RepID=UPI0006D62DCC|nr:MULTISPECIES: hypothetical protein [Pseudomonas syringae group]KAA8692003.1 hypothetical protein F4W67_23430 [Pseudomonas caricapapayae]MCF5714312.1 hypothetical protein [Pseudomonas tremae]UQB29923.1 hypothetical protein I9H06_16260 [Pseudomonas tremae]